MSRFSRPTFQAPALPTPPAAVARPSTAVTALKALTAVTPRPSSLSIGNFSVNAGLAQARSRLAGQKQAALKAKARALPAIPPVPSSVAASPTALRSLQESTNQLFSAASTVDEFGLPR